jgi:hypothetical protein
VTSVLHLTSGSWMKGAERANLENSKRRCANEDVGTPILKSRRDIAKVDSDG